MKNLHSLLTIGLVTAFAFLGPINSAQAGYSHEMLNPETVPAVAASALPANCRLLADDLTRLQPIYIDCNSVNGLSATPIAGSFTTILASSTITGGAASNIAINTNKFTVAASSGNTAVGGTLAVTGAATAASLNGLTVTTSTGTLTIPNGVVLTGPAASGTAATLAGTETLTNKTLTSPIITGPAPVACGSTCALGAANLGGYTRLDTAGGSAATLPAATGTGNTYKLYISVATTSAQDKILLTTVTDTIIGTAQGENAGTAKVFVGNAGTYHSIQMPFAGSQPSGGNIGDTITCTDVASTIYKCDIQYQAGTTPTTPYNAGTT